MNVFIFFRKVYSLECTGLIPYVPVSSSKAKPTLHCEAEQVKCSICNEQQAVCFCLGCEQKLCDEHFKVSTDKYFLTFVVSFS